MECPNPLNKNDSFLGVSVRYWIVIMTWIWTDVQAIPGQDRRLKIVEWSELEPFRSIEGSMQAIRSNPGIEPFKNGLHWPQQIFQFTGSTKVCCSLQNSGIDS